MVITLQTKSRSLTPDY